MSTQSYAVINHLRSKILPGMSISICSHAAHFAQKDKKDVVHSEPPPIFILTEEPINILEYLFLICLENRVVHEVIELSNDHARWRYLAVEWVGFILVFGPYA